MEPIPDDKKLTKHEVLVESVRHLNKSIKRLEDFVERVKGGNDVKEMKNTDIAASDMNMSLADTLEVAPARIEDISTRVNVAIVELEKVLF